MKRTFFTAKVVATLCFIIICNINVIAQGGQKFATGGNNLSASDRLGSNNYADLNFYTNSLKRMTLTKDGNLNVFGQSIFYQYATFDSLLTAFSIKTNTLTVINDAHINGLLTVGNTLTFDGITNNITASSGIIGFGNNNLTTTGAITTNAITASSGTITNTLTAGNIVINGMNPSGFTLLGINQYKQVIPIAFSGNSDEVLTGAGTFIDLPNNSGWKVLNGNIVTTENGNVGIGTNHPVAKLEVIGDAIITGGILTSQVILSDKLQSTHLETDTATSWYSVTQELLSENVQSKTAKIDTVTMKQATVDTISAKKTTAEKMEAKQANVEKVTADTVQTANLKTDSITVAKATAAAVSIGGAVNLANEKLAVIGNTGIYGDFNVTGNIKTAGSLTFAGDKIISYQPINNSVGNYVYGIQLPPFPQIDHCSFPSISNNLNWFNGMTYLWDHNYSNPNMYGVLQLGYDKTNGIIDLSGPDAQLLINYYCGKNVVIGGGGGNLPATGNLEACYNAYFATHSGNVGIGTTAPDAKLDVRGNIQCGGSDFILGKYDNRANPDGLHRALVHDGWQSGKDDLVINYNGDFTDGVYVGGKQTIFEGYVGIGDIQTDPITSKVFIKGVGNSNASSSLNIVNSDGNSMFFVGDDGNVGIGTTCPDQKLTVNGTIHVKDEVVIEDIGNWCDYVFSPTYKLLTFSELGNYINKNRHLPGVKSATEIEKDGFSVLETNKAMMEKIEELTLYILQLEKRVSELEKK